MDDKDIARVLGLARMMFGVALVAAPRLSNRMWTGERLTSLRSGIAMRGVGGRDIALGLGLLLALENDGSVSRWLEAGVVADASDALAILAAARELPFWRLVSQFGLSGGSALLGVKLAAELAE